MDLNITSVSKAYQKLEQQQTTIYKLSGYTLEDIIQMMLAGFKLIKPTADVVEVVRCEKCKHGEVSIISKTIDGKERKACYCNLRNGVTNLDYYCANGERGVVDA